MLLTTLLLALPAYGSGSAAHAAPVRPSLGDRDTLPIAASAEHLVFVGVAGPQVASGGQTLAEEFLTKDWGVALVGNPVRSLSSRDRVVYAVQMDGQADGALRGQRQALRRRRLDADSLHVTSLSLLGNYSSGQLQRALRGIERREDKIWAFHLDRRENLVWVFHEAKLSADAVLAAVRKASIKASYYHQELELEAGPEADVAALANQANQALDLVAANQRDGSLVLDLYIRDVSSFLALQRGRKVVACPDVLPFLRDVPAKDLSWKVTLENRGYPFVN